MICSPCCGGDSLSETENSPTAEAVGEFVLGQIYKVNVVC